MSKITVRINIVLELIIELELILWMSILYPQAPRTYIFQKSLGISKGEIIIASLLEKRNINF